MWTLAFFSLAMIGSGKSLMINWMYFPKSRGATRRALDVVAAFEACASEVDSALLELPSNSVLAKVGPHLANAGFKVELGKKNDEKINVPVLFGLNGCREKSFNADAYDESGKFVVEIEAGRAVVNNQFLKDLFQACMMHDVDYLAIAVRNTYAGANDFAKVVLFFETLYASGRLQLPLNGILIIGY